MTRHIRCPDKIGDEDKNKLYEFLFMAGGISGCTPWQDKMVELLQGRDMILVNPRRLEFDVNDAKMADEQIEWEFTHLNDCANKMFWFAGETLCPITLYEYGYWLAGHMAMHIYSLDAGFKYEGRLYLGIDPTYARKFDLEKQTALVNSRAEEFGVDEQYRVKIAYSLEDLAELIKQDYKQIAQTA